MAQQSFEDTNKAKPEVTEPPVRRGPPNRMNDLAYRDWMKFQKSFFRHTTDQRLVDECIQFFTKAIWPDNSVSRSLVIGVKDFNPSSLQAHRIIGTYDNPESTHDIVERLSGLDKIGEKYDFILIDLRRYIQDKETLSDFLMSDSTQLFKLLRNLLIPQRYCGVIVGMEEAGGGGFPLPWSVALSCRDHLRLRDEKVGLVEQSGSIYYCLFMQAEDDNRPSVQLQPKKLRTAATQINIPAWIIPKPPPRKKDEILHPAKYPETLVGEFIQMFTRPGDTVFDPMVGTGSSVIAALRTRRNGVATELNPSFAEIARQRAASEQLPRLFEEFEPQSLIIQGDATHLTELKELADVTLDYAITSPPYWSMLTNPGSENQENRRKKNLPLVYSDSDRDLGNIEDYESFLDLLEVVYSQVAEKLAAKGHLTVVVKNVKRNHILYTLAWDLTMRLCRNGGRYEYIGTTLWCQDDVGLKPFAVGIHWVSNILHHYCLHFRKRT